MLSVPQPVAVQTWAPAAGFDSGARLAFDSDVAKQPALLAKLGILDSDVRRGPAGEKTLLLLPRGVRPGWTIKIGRAQVCTPFTNEKLEWRLLLEKKTHKTDYK